MMQEVHHFGSVTVVVSGTRESAVVLSHHPDTLHEHTQDWDNAVRFLLAEGFAVPDDEPTTSSPEAGETYTVRKITKLVAVSA